MADQSSTLGFGIGNQLLVAHLQDAARQDGIPMVHQRPVGPVITSQLRQVPGERLAPAEELEVARQVRVHGIAYAVDDPRRRSHQLNQSDVEEVQRHLVGDPCLAGCARPQSRHVGVTEGAHGPRFELTDIFGKTTTGAGPGAFRQPIEIIELAGGEDLGMAGQYLLDERRSGPRHAEDEDRYVGRISTLSMTVEQVGTEDVGDPLCLCLVFADVIAKTLAAQTVSPLEAAECRVEVLDVLVRLCRARNTGA